MKFDITDLFSVSYSFYPLTATFSVNVNARAIILFPQGLSIYTMPRWNMKTKKIVPPTYCYALELRIENCAYDQKEFLFIVLNNNVGPIMNDAWTL